MHQVRDTSRQFGRRQLACHAVIEVGLGQKIPCVVKKLLRSGALLEFCGDAPHANKFCLTVEHEKLSVECEVHKRDRQSLSVRFRRDARCYEISREKKQSGGALAQNMRRNLTRP